MPDSLYYCESMKTLADLPAMVQKKYGEMHPVFHYKAAGVKESVSAAEYAGKSKSAAAFLHSCGLTKHDRVLSIISNSPDWHYLEMGIFLCGAIHVPLSPLMDIRQIEYVITNAEPSLILVYSSAKKKQVESVLAKLNLTAAVFNIRDQNIFSHAASESSTTALDEDDVAVILYTSGTTDNPKGVALTHKNIISAITEFSAQDIFNGCTDALSLLPINHSGERKLNYSYLLRGISICFPGTVDSMTDCLNFFRPQITATVPYLLQQLLSEVPADYNFNGLKVVCGGAPLHRHIHENFTRRGGKIFEVYGLTETASLLSYNTAAAQMPDTVGKLAKNISVTFSGQGEIWVKGDSVMKGYWINKNKIDACRNEEGWFRTGDTGHLNDRGFLCLTGRNNNYFKNSKGVFVNPEPIEKQLTGLLHSEFVIVYANETGYLSAIIKPQNGLSNELERNTFIHYNNSTADDLKINRYLSLREMKNGMVTDNLKLNRNKIIANYKEQTFEHLF